MPDSRDDRTARREHSWFQRFLLPGLAFKAVVIGGGYATGRELAEFFLPSGPVGRACGDRLRDRGLQPVCGVTFVLARRLQAFDYGASSSSCSVPAGSLFEGAYILFIVLILAVYGAAAGAIGAAVFGAAGMGGHARADGRHHRVVDLRQQVGRAPVRLCLLPALRRLRAVRRPRVQPASATRSGRLCAQPADRRLGVGGLTYAGYNIDRRGRSSCRCCATSPATATR